MDLKEALKQSGEIGDFPVVEVNTHIKYASSRIGKIVEINTRVSLSDFLI
jgi:hypothetical protein